MAKPKTVPRIRDYSNLFERDVKQVTESTAAEIARIKAALNTALTALGLPTI